MTNNSKNDFGITKMLFSFLAGIGVGYVCTLFMEEQKKEAQREALKEAAVRAKDIFEENTVEMRSRYRDIREQFIAALAELKGTVKGIDKQKYEDALDRVLKDIKKEQKLSQSQVNKLKDYFTTDFDKIKQSLLKS